MQKLLEKHVEDEFVRIVLQYVSENDFTILNLRQVIDTVVGVMEANATMKMEVSDSTETSTT